MSKNLNRSDVIWDTIGGWGRWQKRSVFLVFICKIISCWFMAIILFTSPIPKPSSVRCYSEVNDTFAGIDESNITINKYRWYTVLHPHRIVPTDRPFDIDFCDVTADINEHIYRDSRDNNSEEENENQMNTLIVPCHTFTHRSFISAKRTTFDWVCSRNIVAAFTQLFYLFGVLSGGILAWRLLEFISPKNLLLCGMIGQIISGISLAFLNDYKLQLLFRYLSSISCAQMYTSGQMILSDIISEQYLRLILPLFDTFWSIGVILLPLIAYFASNWKGMYLAITMPTFLYIGIWYFIADSPRWHLKKGNIAHATKILLGAAETNKKSCVVRGNFIEGLRPDRFTQQIKLEGWCSLWRCNQNFVNIVCIHLIWGAILTNFNGMLLNTRNFGGAFVHRNVAMTGVVELLGACFAGLFLMENTRKWVWSGLMNIIAGFAIIFLFLATTEQIHRKYSTIIMLVNLTLKFMVSIALWLITSSTTELVEPKQHRALLISCTIWGRTCLLTASFIGSLSLFSTLLPLSVFAMNSIVAGIAMCIINPNNLKNQKITSDQIELQEVERLTNTSHTDKDTVKSNIIEQFTKLER